MILYSAQPAFSLHHLYFIPMSASGLCLRFDGQKRSISAFASSFGTSRVDFDICRLLVITSTYTHTIRAQEVIDDMRAASRLIFIWLSRLATSQPHHLSFPRFILIIFLISLLLFIFDISQPEILAHICIFSDCSRQPHRLLHY